MTKILFIVAISFCLASAAGIFLIPLLHRLKFGQEIREEGPKWHKSKSGTPTMGGFIFIIASLLSVFAGLLMYRADGTAVHAAVAILTVSLAFGAIGFVDDYIKVILKRNLGLRAMQKLALQILAAVLFAVWLTASGIVKPEISLPFTAIKLAAPYWVYIPLAVLVMLAAVNSVNLTDGLDGLAACVTLVVCVFYCAASKREDAVPVTVFAASLAGGLLGFLIYNRFPAKVFMGDTGSLFLGGAVAAMAIYMKNPFLLLIVGFVYVAESLSVIIQVTYFKKTGKRIFKMSPIHHHFEMCGWSEKKIVAVFSAVTAVLCVIGFFA